MDKVQRIQIFAKALHSLYTRRTCSKITRKLSRVSSSTQEGVAPSVKQEHSFHSIGETPPILYPDWDECDLSFESESEDAYVSTTTVEDATHSFPYLLRHSSFINIGDPREKTVAGEIFHVIDDDLYIDFGWKFHCVCRKPQRNQEKYIRGAKVKLIVRNLELSTRFLGATRDITLCEADCSLKGLSEH